MGKELGLMEADCSINNNPKNQNQQVCRYWLAGRCSRRPCPYLHSTPEHPMPPLHSTDASSYQQQGRPSKFVWVRGHGSSADADAAAPPPPKLCRYWMDGGNCSAGDNCRFLHSWFTGDDFTMLAHLPGHHKAITGITLLTDSAKLYSASNVRAWDCHSGESTAVFHLGAEIGCLLSEGPWLFVGTPNTVRAWNTQTNADISLGGPVGQVYSLAVAEKGNGMLFAGPLQPVLLCSSNNNVVYVYDLPSFEQRGKIFSKEEVRVIQAGPEGIFITGDGTGDLRVWKWSETTAA